MNRAAQAAAGALCAMCALALLCAQAAPPSAAEPDTRSMIEALMPSPSRGMRNLLVRPKPEAGSAGSAAAAASAAVPSAVPGAVAVVGSGVASAAAAGAASAAAPVAAYFAAPVEAPVEASVATAAPTVAVATPEASAGPAPSLSLAIRFEANSARVRPESGVVLGSLVAAMQSPELKASRFLIEGHTDARGAAAQNQRLSQERADEVRLYLVALGVNPARLRAVGKGATQPTNSGDPNAAENRRVRVVTVE